MRRTVLKAVALFASVALVVGCGEKKASIPTNLEQPLPKVAAPAGGGGEPAVPKKGTAGGDKKAPPVGKSD